MNQPEQDNTAEASPTSHRPLGKAVLRLIRDVEKSNAAARVASTQADVLTSRFGSASREATNARGRRHTAEISRDAGKWRLLDQHGVDTLGQIDPEQIEKVTRDDSGVILDHRGKPLGSDVARARAWTKEHADKVTKETPVHDSLVEELGYHHPRTASARKRLQHAQAGMDAMQWREREHYIANQAAYQQQALEDAAAAGREDIGVGWGVEDIGQVPKVAPRASEHRVA